jgi:hypothetical protein
MLLERSDDEELKKIYCNRVCNIVKVKSNVYLETLWLKVIKKINVSYIYFQKYGCSIMKAFAISCKLSGKFDFHVTFQQRSFLKWWKTKYHYTIASHHPLFFWWVLAFFRKIFIPIFAHFRFFFSVQTSADWRIRRAFAVIRRSRCSKHM